MAKMAVDYGKKTQDNTLIMEKSVTESFKTFSSTEVSSKINMNYK